MTSSAVVPHSICGNERKSEPGRLSCRLCRDARTRESREDLHLGLLFFFAEVVDAGRWQGPYEDLLPAQQPIDAVGIRPLRTAG